MYGRMHNQNSAQYILYYNRALYHIEKRNPLKVSCHRRDDNLQRKKTTKNKKKQWDNYNIWIYIYECFSCI